MLGIGIPESGTPVACLTDRIGWESPEMMRRFAHLADHLAPCPERLRALPAGETLDYGSITAQA
jgi:hypothetical protein